VLKVTENLGSRSEFGQQVGLNVLRYLSSVWLPTLWHPWVAQRHRRKRHEMSQTHSGKGCQRHPALVTVNPCMVATNAGTLCNPFSATHKQPLPKIYTQDMCIKCHPNPTILGGSDPDGLAPQPSPIQTRSTLAGVDIYQKCSRSGSEILGSS
jgi:hypothetical protein